MAQLKLMLPNLARLGLINSIEEPVLNCPLVFFWTLQTNFSLVAPIMLDARESRAIAAPMTSRAQDDSAWKTSLLLALGGSAPVNRQKERADAEEGTGELILALTKAHIEASGS